MGNKPIDLCQLFIMISFKMMISWFPAQDKEFSIAVLMAHGNVLQLLHNVDFFELHKLCSILHLKMAHVGVDQPRTEECSHSSTGSPFHSCPACLFQNHHLLLSCFSQGQVTADTFDVIMKPQRDNVSYTLGDE